MKMSDTRWNVLILVLRRFRSLNPALRLLHTKIPQAQNLKADKVFFAASISFLYMYFFPFRYGVQRKEYRDLWDSIDEPDTWKQVEELECTLLRLQSIFASRQVEREPTFSSIPAWLKQCMNILTVYDDDHSVIREYKTLTAKV